MIVSAIPFILINFLRQSEFLRSSVGQRRLACSVGDISPTGVRVRSPVAWIAFVEETKWMKPIDKAILGMVSESPGRNVSEPRGSLDKNESGGRAPCSGAKAEWQSAD